MTIGPFDVMWGLMLFGVALFCGCTVVFNPVLRGIRWMGLATAYAVFAFMLSTLEWRVAVATWCVFAAAGGAVALAYELWARWRYRGTGRRPRPLILLQGFLLWPALIPEAVEGMLVDLGVLAPSWRAGSEEPPAAG